jgi:hypothetical protein
MATMRIYSRARSSTIGLGVPAGATAPMISSVS